MYDFTDEQVILDGVGKLQATFTGATTDIITSNGHGFSGGELLQFTTSGTLPAGLSTATDYYVRDVTTNTFKVSATPDGAVVDITDTGTGTHTFHLKGRAIMTKGYRHLFLNVNTSGSANLTMKVQGSRQDAKPDFNASQSATNHWDYVQIKDTEDGSSIDGDTGLVLAGTDDNRNFTVNVDGMAWVTVVITAWSAGLLRASLVASNG